MLRVYPWEKWLAKKKFVLRQGRDFLCAPRIMAQQVRNRASKCNLRSHVEPRGDDTLICSFHEREESQDD